MSRVQGLWIGASDNYSITAVNLKLEGTILRATTDSGMETSGRGGRRRVVERRGGCTEWRGGALGRKEKKPLLQAPGASGSPAATAEQTCIGTLAQTAYLSELEASSTTRVLVQHRHACLRQTMTTCVTILSST